MAGFGDNSRVKGVSIVKPIIYGNVSHYFGKKRETDGHTHGWTVYIKPYKTEDMSSYVKKVHFKLHESYANPLRVITKPPYEVNESGWGEFEITIKIFFMDPQERPVTLYHLLKLFQTESALASGKKQLVAEFYDEVIFQDPTQMMHQCLLSTKQLPPVKHESDWIEIEQRTINSIATARSKIGKEITQLNERLKASRNQINHLKDEIASLEQDEQPDQQTTPGQSQPQLQVQISPLQIDHPQVTTTH
ncbi:YEATS domain-containing protein 4-like [Actinia tenebrosa]|uniref:YEATS domain-containing protein 4 n=1 Tax=Actinia tenebrosa TaxID=6105 RepID=A0A6P8J390_ACTTE|nr:YEATS domain-containing protein 4-like [Actinia tenebrosa]